MSEVEFIIDKSEEKILNGSHDAQGSIHNLPSVKVDESSVSKAETRKANKDLMDYMLSILQDGRKESAELQQKLKRTYWVIVLLSTLMFLVGLALISTPLWTPFVDNAPSFQFILTSVGIGIAELFGLYLFNPLARIQKLMGDMSQLTVALDSFTLQVALRLLEADIDERKTVGVAATNIETAASAVLGLVEAHFEKWLYKQLGV